MPDKIKYDPDMSEMDMNMGADPSDEENEGLSQSDLERTFEALVNPIIEKQTQQGKQFDETQVEIDGIDRAVVDAEDQLLLPQDALYHDRDQDFSVEPQHESFTVAVEIANNPDYIGLTASTGVVRCDSTITKTQAVAGDGYVTLSHWDSSALNGTYPDPLVGLRPILSITVDDRGHVTSLTAADENYATEAYVTSAVAAQTYIGLADTTDASYSGHAGDVPMVNAGEDGLELATFGTFAAANGLSWITWVAPIAPGGALQTFHCWGTTDGAA